MKRLILVAIALNMTACGVINTDEVNRAKFKYPECNQPSNIVDEWVTDRSESILSCRDKIQQQEREKAEAEAVEKARIEEEQAKAKKERDTELKRVCFDVVKANYGNQWRIAAMFVDDLKNNDAFRCTVQIYKTGTPYYTPEFIHYDLMKPEVHQAD